MGETRRLIIAPHYDDEVLGCGGLLASHPDGSAVMFLCGRTYNHRPLDADTHKAARYANRAKFVLGYEHIYYASFEDECLDKSFVPLLSRMERILDAWKPELILVPHPGDAHQDHRTAFQAAQIACRGYAMASYFVPSGSEVGFHAHDVFYPNYVLPLGEAELYQKKMAMREYKDEMRPWPHRRSVEGIDVCSKFWGSHFGMSIGEPFYLIRT